MVAKLEDRPPYVRFEKRAEEDRTASIAAGSYRGKDIDYALITPTGSKDCIERIVSEWFEKLDNDVREGRMPQAWLTSFKESYKAWQEGQELPVKGTPILTWPPISPAQLKAFQSAGIRTVEDLAVANEETLNRIGMGARAMKQRAVDWLASATDSGKFNAEVSDIRAKNLDLQTRNQSLETKVATLERQVAVLSAGMPIPPGAVANAVESSPDDLPFLAKS